MAAAANSSEWILLGSTIVRKDDIRRVDVSTQFGIIYNVYITYGPMIRIQRDDFGAGWLHEQYLAARAATLTTAGSSTPESDTE